MSCRKFHAPRHGSLQFRPKKRADSVRTPIKSYPADDESKQPHLTAFLSYKAGMTHVIRTKEVRAKNKVQTKEILDAVTILETPPMIVHGVVGYVQTVKGLVRSGMVLSKTLDEGVIRKMFAKKYVFGMKHEDLRKNTEYSEEDLNKLQQSDCIRVICHSQVHQINSIRQKKTHIAEIQINGGSIKQKIEYGVSKLDKEVFVSEVFKKDEYLDTIGVTKGKGFQGTVKRWGTTILPRKTNKGIRKVACIGAWHPSRVMYSVARCGQMGFHRRTQQNLLIYAVGNGKQPLQTDFDLTVKTVNPMGGFPHYGDVKSDFVMVKGCVQGPSKRVVTLRQPVHSRPTKEVCIKFVDTSSKIGKGRFQTSEEKRVFYGISKPEVVNNNL
ncbi:ribosomal prt L3 [Nucleospora cyclopteri]